MSIIKLRYSLLALVFLNGCMFKNKEITRQLERHRPLYHFSPPSQWMNDPNGMVYYDGEYHLFYQHYPDSNVWGPMHWGHAVSRDLVHWKHLPIALYPDDNGYIFSGSAVMDLGNTSGLGTPENPPMVALFTYHDMKGERAGRLKYQSQALAYSLDKGRSWVKYAHNPVIENPGIRDFRDPKVSWYEDGNKWVVILAVKDRVNIYSSDNLIDWQFESEFGHGIGSHGGVWECPDLFRLADETGAEAWVMLVSINPGGPQGGSATQYFIGDFDGHQFIPADSVMRWVDYGADNYAGVTWSNVPAEDGRRLLIGWMSNWDYAQVVPTAAWRSAMTLPRELRLKGMNLLSGPVEEMVSLRANRFDFELEEETWTLPGSLLELEFQLDGSGGKQCQVVFSNPTGEELIIDVKPGELTVDRTRAGIADFSDAFAKKHKAPLTEDVSKLRIYMDQSSMELFVNDGALVMTELVFPGEPYSKVQIIGDRAMVERGERLYPSVNLGKQCLR